MSSPEPSSVAAQRRMRATRQRDTAAEMAIRRILHALGFRFRVDFQVLPDKRTRADIVFTRAKVAIFVDGCFWHSCPIHQTRPKANADWWTAKLEKNRERDARANQFLLSAGWHVERVWEHESPEDAASRIAEIVRDRSGKGSVSRP